MITDELFLCTYRFVHGHTVNSSLRTLAERAAQSDYTDQKYRDLAVNLREVTNLSYDRLLAEKYTLKDKAKQRENREALVTRFIGKDGLNAILTDAERVNLLTNETYKKSKEQEKKPATKRQARATAPARDNVDNVIDIRKHPLINSWEWPNISDTGKPFSTIPNLEVLIKHYGINVRYNEMSKDVEVTVPGKSGCDSSDNIALAELFSIASANRLPTINIEMYLKAIAQGEAYNPVRDFILSTEWDGKSRFDALLNTISTPDDYDRDLLSILLRRWLISAVAAAFKNEGFWSKGVLVFQGEQSIGKTSWFKALVPLNLSHMVKEGALIDPSNKDSIAGAISHWLVELGELDATFRKADIARLKSFISQSRDDLRRPYDRIESKYPRRTVFFASVNPKNFLADDTGNVRWWTVPVTALNYNHGIDTQQLWAEVYEWFINGDQWWLDREEEKTLEAVNEQHAQIDPIEEMILSRFDWSSYRDTAYTRMTASEVVELIGVPITPSNTTKCGKILRKLTGSEPKKSHGKSVFNLPPRALPPMTKNF